MLCASDVLCGAVWLLWVEVSRVVGGHEGIAIHARVPVASEDGTIITGCSHCRPQCRRDSGGTRRGRRRALAVPWRPRIFAQYAVAQTNYLTLNHTRAPTRGSRLY